MSQKYKGKEQEPFSYNASASPDYRLPQGHQCVGAPHVRLSPGSSLCGKWGPGMKTLETQAWLCFASYQLNR